MRRVSEFALSFHRGLHPTQRDPRIQSLYLMNECDEDEAQILSIPHPLRTANYYAAFVLRFLTLNVSQGQGIYWG